MNSSFQTFKDFIATLQFIEKEDAFFYHTNLKVILFFVQSNQQSLQASFDLQGKVLELRKESWKVLVVREDVWKNKEQLIRSVIIFKMQKLISVFARDLQVKKITEIEAIDFLQKNHLLGACKSKIYIALKIPPHRAFRFEKYGFSGDTMAVAVFGKNMTRKKEGFEGQKSIEWARFATLPSIRIVGGISKVFDFVNDLSPFDDVMTYVDIESNDAKGLLSLGFHLEEILDPMAISDGFNLGNYKLRYVKS